jgi:hypothetical protein
VWANAVGRKGMVLIDLTASSGIINPSHVQCWLVHRNKKQEVTNELFTKRFLLVDDII